MARPRAAGVIVMLWGGGWGVLFYRIMRLFTMRLFAEADCHAAFILRRRAVLCEL